MDDTDLRESFDHFDADGDGRIDINEFGRLCRALGGEIDDMQRNVGFREIDTDASGSIEFNEFVAWWRNQL
ncbi:MAG: EF-hand domain-containing protein [Pseudomonadota bacterium]